MSGAHTGPVDRLLTGVMVLELGQVIAGTYAGLILADLGAEVIKIEPLSGDANRNPAIAPLFGESAIHLFMNRNKKSVALNLKSAEGRELFYRLVAQADVAIDNFRPGVNDRLGISHETLIAHKPDIITTSITGFGGYGPWKDLPAFDLVIQALAGHMAITGESDGPPARIGIPLADISGGLFGCISVLAGLTERGLRGRGSHSDVSMLDSMVSLLSYDALDHLNSGRQISRIGTAHAHMVPWQAIPVQDGYIVLAVREEKFWHRLCDAIDRPDLRDDPRTATNHARLAHRGYVTEVLEQQFSTRSKGEWMEILSGFDVPAAPVNDLADVFANPQVAARGLVRAYDHPVHGAVRYPASPMQFDDWKFPNAPAPALSEHTAEVLRERLGLDEREISSLVERDIVGAIHDLPNSRSGL